MDTFRIVEIPAPGAVDAPVSPAYQAWHEIFAESMREILGHDDFSDPPAALVANYADQKHSAKTLLMAVAAAGDEEAGAAAADRRADPIASPESVLGYASVSLPRTDNTHLAQVDVVVRPAARRRGIGSALWRELEHRVRASGRTTVTTWTSHATEAPEGADALVAPTGVGRILATDAGARFAVDHGFSLEQGERQSTLHLPVQPEALAGWRAEAEAAAGPDYRVVQWQDRTPDQWLDALAELQRRMSVDVPMAGLDFQEEVWDADRVRDMDTDIAQAGQHYVLTAVEHLPTRSLVAFTQLVMSTAKPEVVYQYNTLVHGDHRGRRLGLLVKAANLQLLAEAQPAARRVHTWNAGENQHMLAINVRMGFVPASVEGAWQRRFVADGTSATAAQSHSATTAGATSATTAGTALSSTSASAVPPAGVAPDPVPAAPSGTAA